LPGTQRIAEGELVGLSVIVQARLLHHNIENEEFIL